MPSWAFSLRSWSLRGAIRFLVALMLVKLLSFGLFALYVSHGFREAVLDRQRLAQEAISLLLEFEGNANEFGQLAGQESGASDPNTASRARECDRAARLALDRLKAAENRGHGHRELEQLAADYERLSGSGLPLLEVGPRFAAARALVAPALDILESNPDSAALENAVDDCMSGFGLGRCDVDAMLLRLRSAASAPAPPEIRAAHANLLGYLELRRQFESDRDQLRALASGLDRRIKSYVRNRAREQLADINRSSSLLLRNIALALAGFLLVFGLVNLFGYLVLYAFRRSLEDLVELSDNLGASTLFLRGNEQGPREVIELSRSLNRTAARLEETVVSKEALAESDRALRGALARWNRTFDALEIALVVLKGREREILHANRQAATMLGVDPVSIVGRRLGELAAAEPWSLSADLVDSAWRSGEPVTVRHRSESADRTWTLGFSPYEVSPEDIRGALWLRDDTELDRLEAAARRNERMAEFGQLLGGVAHEVRNPLFAITANLDAWETVEPAIAHAEFARRIRHEARKLAELMHDLLEFGRPHEEISERVDLRPLAAAACEEVSRRPEASGLDLANLCPADLPLVRGEGSRLQQALRNLLENAVLHSPPGGRVTLRAEVAESPGSGAGGTCVVLTVEDQGPGFPPDARNTLFEPFVTHRRGGIGLGLAIVRRAIDSAGGEVFLENRAEGGARVRVRLPAGRNA